MHLEIQVALNFLISFLYNKLPRRRVNQFGEELETALKVKFAAHWYPGDPAKGSAYRCLKTATPLDPVFEIAANNCGLQLIDIANNLPAELCIWIDPGEVSYRMAEKGQVKLLYQENNGTSMAERECMLNKSTILRETNDLQSYLDPMDSMRGDARSPAEEAKKIRSFNPDAQCFKPDSLSLSGSFNAFTSTPASNGTYNGYNFSAASAPGNNTSATGAKSPLLTPAGFAKGNQMTMTTAQFAQTKFGSTKLKSATGPSNGLVCGINGSSGNKRQYGNRMSPTEFSNYIKQRALMQSNGANSASLGSSSTFNASPFSMNSANSLNTPTLNRAVGSVPVAASAPAYTPFSGSNQLMLSLSPQDSRCISPMSPVNKSNTNPMNLLMMQQPQQNGISYSKSLSGSTMPSLNLSSSARDYPLDVNYLSNLFQNTSLSPVMGASAHKTRHNSFGGSGSSRFGVNLLDKPEPSGLSDLLAASSGLGDSSFLNIGNDFGSNRLGSPNMLNHLDCLVDSTLNEELDNCGSSNSMMLMPQNISSLGAKMPESGQLGDSEADSSSGSQSSGNECGEGKSYNPFEISLNGVPYPNQYQHLLVAN